MIDALLATLEREADGEIARVLAEGRTRAAAIIAESDRRIADRKRAAFGVLEADGRTALARVLATARYQARGRVLVAREALLQRLFAALREFLPEMTGTEAYRARLAEDLPRALAFAGERPVTVQCTPALVTVLQRLAKTNGRLRVEPTSQIAAGYRVVTMDGGLEVDATLEGWIEQLRPRLALEALAALGAAS